MLHYYSGKPIKASMLLLLLLLFINADRVAKKVEVKNVVYLCGSGRGQKYHLDATCRGLSNCHYKTMKSTLEKAKKEDKTLCKWED